MKIIQTSSAVVHYVETDEAELNLYTRHSPEYWTVTMGESEEIIHDCEELERLFQNYISAD